MDTTLLIIAILVVILPTAMLTSMFLLKSGSAHSERMAREQEQMDRKNGIAPRTRTASENANENRKFEWVKSNLLTILLVIVGVVALYWGYNTQVRPEDVGIWSHNKWFPLLVLWGVLATLIALNAKEKTAAALQSVLAGVMFALLVALPLWSWIVASAAPPPQRAATPQADEIPLASMPQSEWPKLVIPTKGIRLIPISPGKRVTAAGYNFVLHTVYTDGRDCTERCPDYGVKEVYAENISATEIIVAYAYTPISN